MRKCLESSSRFTELFFLWIKMCPTYISYCNCQQQGVLGQVYPTYNWALVKLFLNNFWKYVHTLCMLKLWKKLPILINQLCHLQYGLQCFLPLVWHHVVLHFDMNNYELNRSQIQNCFTSIIPLLQHLSLNTTFQSNWNV